MKLKKRVWDRCFPVKFAKFLRTLFLQNTSGQLLLDLYFIGSLWLTEIYFSIKEIVKLFHLGQLIALGCSMANIWSLLLGTILFIRCKFLFSQSLCRR